jgi:hypothetical protein
LLAAVALWPIARWYFEVWNIPVTDVAAVEHHPRSRAAIHSVPHPLLFTAEYYVRTVSDFATHVLTPVGALVLLLGGIGVGKLRSASFFALVAAFGLLLAALPLKFFAANYYYVVVLPAAALATGAAWRQIVARFQPSARIQAVIGIVFLACAARYAVGPAFKTPPGDRSVETAADAARRQSPADQPLATLHGSSVDLLYYCDRRGWALDASDPRFAERLEVAVAGGAQYLVVADLATAYDRSATIDVLRSLAVVDSGDDWQLLELPKQVRSASRPATEDVAGATSKE